MKLEIEFDQATRDFVKKIKARKIVEPPPLHLKLENPPVMIMNGSQIIEVHPKQLERLGWRRK